MKCKKKHAITVYSNVAYFIGCMIVSVCPVREDNSQSKRTVCHRSPGAQVKVAAVVKTSLTTCTTPKPDTRKRRKIHPSGFRGKGKQIYTYSDGICIDNSAYSIRKTFGNLLLNAILF